MSDFDSSFSQSKDENSSHSFDNSNGKTSLLDDQQSSEVSDSEVERSDNELSNDNKSESNEPTTTNQLEEEEYSNDESVQSKEKSESDNEENYQGKFNLNEEDSRQSNGKEHLSVKDDRLSLKEEHEDKKSNSDSDSDVEQNKPKESFSDNEDEEQESEEEIKLSKKKRREANEIFGDSDSEDDEQFTRLGKRKNFSDSSEEGNSDVEVGKKKQKSLGFADSDSDDEHKDSNLEKKENEETNKEDKNEKKILPDISSSSSDDELEDDRRSKRQTEDFVYDFDLMMAKRKEQNSRNRKHKNTDIINDSDDFIADLLQQMKQAAEDDFELNKDRKAATRKMKLLPHVQMYLRKINLRESFLDSGVLSVITDWLTPLPDRSLPNLQVRESMLKILIELSIMDVDRLKSSSIGKAVMYLFKHPKETKENKRRAAQLISNWSRPIFNCETDYQAITKEDREQRDYENMHKAHHRLPKSNDQPNSSQSSSTDHTSQQQLNLRPGDKGWVPRARVPMPSTKDYVVRPKSNVNIDFEIGRSSSKKPTSRLDKHLRSFQEKKRSSKMQQAVKISIEGRKL